MTAMRHITLILAVLVVAAFSPAHAYEKEVMQTIEQYFTASMGTGENQDKYCGRPRSNDTERCIQDFLDLQNKAMEALGWSLLHKRSKLANNAASTEYFRLAAVRSFDEMMAALRKVRSLYYPR